MFFARRRHALRVIEKMGLNVRSPEATEIAEMIIAGAKQYAAMFPNAPVKVSKLEQVLWSVAAMTDNASAYNRLSRSFGMSNERVNVLMRLARQAGRDVAIESGLPEVVTRFYDRLRPVGHFTAQG